MTRTPGGGPKVVALGGGHGLAATLTAVRHYAGQVTAIVSVADDGGSSGRLRQAFGIPAPGDVRRCLVALAGDPGSAVGRAFEHRFAAGELDGHVLGNLVIAGLTEATGDFTTAIDEAARLLGAVGRVLPATAEPVVLRALTAGRRKGDGREVEVEGQVAVQNHGRITEVSLVPDDPATPPEAVGAIHDADQVVVGPGSLFTSLAAVLAVPAIREALDATRATKVYVANLREQEPETAGYDLAAHVAALRAHGLDPDVVLTHPGALAVGECTYPVVARDVARPDLRAHDPARLAVALADLVG